MTPNEIVPYIKLVLATLFMVFCVYQVTKDIFTVKFQDHWMALCVVPFLTLLVYSLYMFVFNIMFDVGLKIIGT